MLNRVLIALFPGNWIGDTIKVFSPPGYIEVEISEESRGTEQISVLIDPNVFVLLQRSLECIKSISEINPNQSGRVTIQVEELLNYSK